MKATENLENNKSGDKNNNKGNSKKNISDVISLMNTKGVNVSEKTKRKIEEAYKNK